MSYEKQTWVNGVSPLNAERLNHMEDGIFAVAESVEELKQNGTGGGACGTTTETITKTGVMVSFETYIGTEIVVSADTAETVELYHSGINQLPHGIRKNYAPGMNVVQNPDGTATFSGTPTEKGYFHCTMESGDDFWLPAGNYTFKIFGFPTVGSASPVTFSLETVDGSAPFDGAKAIAVHAFNDGRQFTTTTGALVRGVYAVNTNVPGDVTIGVMLGRNVTKTSEWVAPTLDKVETTLPTTLVAHDGFNVLYTGSGDTLTASIERTVSQNNADSFDASVYGIPVMTLDGECTGMTKDDYVSLAYTFQGRSGSVEVKKQGSSSIQTGIEIGGGFDADLGGLFNFTMKFPEAFEAKTGWGAQKKYVFKANAIDHSHARNVCSCKLWGQIVKSRANVPTALAGLVNGGAIDGFPIIIVLNGKFYALGTFNIPKDGWMFGSPKAILCADDHTDATKFKALATLDGDFELEYVEDENNADWVLTSINTAIQAVMNSTGTDIDTTVGQYIDIPSAIDYYIHTVDESADDGTSKNYILVTFDGVKWYFSAYDRDTTYGLFWNGKTIDYQPVGIDFATYSGIHKLMELIYTYKKAELKARAIALRDGVKSEINVANVFTKFAADIPAALYDQNCKRWPLLRSTSVSNVAQILNWYRLRRMYLDKLIDAM